MAWVQPKHPAVERLGVGLAHAGKLRWLMLTCLCGMTVALGGLAGNGVQHGQAGLV
jgi:hypothetical protein